MSFINCDYSTGCKENHFYSLPFRQAEASIYQPRRHFNQPQKLFDEQNNSDFTVLLLFEFLKKRHLPIGQVKNIIYWPNGKINQPQAIGHYFLCMLIVCYKRYFIRPSNTDQKKMSCESELQCSLCGKRLQRGRVLSVYGEVCE